LIPAGARIVLTEDAILRDAHTQHTFTAPAGWRGTLLSMTCPYDGAARVQLDGALMFGQEFFAAYRSFALAPSDDGRGGPIVHDLNQAVSG
jgi:hypothetical protein